MIGLSRYYVSRALLSLVLGILLALTGAPWWIAVLAGLTVFGFFVWAPRSDRYAVQPEQGVTALRRDERTQAINDRAARNGFVVVMLALAMAAIYFGTVSKTDVPVFVLHLTLVLAALTYIISDIWMRRL